MAELNPESPVGVTLDGGGGTLRWAAWRGEQMIASGDLPGAVLQLLGWQAYRARLDDALRVALRAAGAPAEALALAGMGLSGVDRPPEVEAIYAWLREAFPGLRQAWVSNDAWPALRDGAGALDGILLICGTGTVCLGSLKPAGEGRPMRHVRVGGWGSLLDDAGAGYWLGLQWAQYACRCADGRVDDPLALQAVLEHWNLKRGLDLIPFVNQMDRGEQRAAIAGLCRLLRQAAEAGNAFALKTQAEGAACLAGCVAACARQLRAQLPGAEASGAEERPLLPVIGHGAVLRNWPAYKAAVQQALAGRLPGVELLTPEINPLAGAWALASEFPFMRT